MKEFVIEPKVEGKGRSFVGTCLGLCTANYLFPEGSEGKTIRPVWALFAGTEQELRPFVENLALGRKASPFGKDRGGDGERLEFLRSVGYQRSFQREPEGTLATLYHPELFRLDPGLVDPNGLSFVLLVPSDWSADQKVDPLPAVKHVHALVPKLEVSYLTSLVPTAYLFAAYLDRRTRCPLLADGRFYLQLLVAALGKGLASLPGRDIKYNRSSYGEKVWARNDKHSFNFEVYSTSSEYDHPGIDTIGLAHAVSFLAEHAAFEAFLAEQVTLFYELTRERRLKGKKVVPALSEIGVDLSAFLRASNG